MFWLGRVLLIANLSNNNDSLTEYYIKCNLFSWGQKMEASQKLCLQILIVVMCEWCINHDFCFLHNFICHLIFSNMFIQHTLLELILCAAECPQYRRYNDEWANIVPAFAEFTVYQITTECDGYGRNKGYVARASSSIWVSGVGESFS